jgi:2-dehydro-3-deoxyglucarate aldolase
MPELHWPNRFRQALLDRERLIGCWAALTGAVSTEVLGYVGFDWLLLDGEHAPNDLGSLAAQIMALKDSDSAPVVRPEWADPVTLKRMLDLGAHNLLLPFIETADQARTAVEATRYPPHGTRGVAVAHRSNRYGMRKDYFSKINDNIAVLVQIETARAIQNVEEIAQVPGVDALFIGPSDLSASLGHFLQPTHEVVQQAIARVVEVGKKFGKSVGILAPVPADAERYLEIGINVVAVGADIGLLREASRALCQRFKPTLAG